MIHQRQHNLNHHPTPKALRITVFEPINLYWPWFFEKTSKSTFQNQQIKINLNLDKHMSTFDQHLMDAPLLNSAILASPFRARQPPEDFTYLPWQGSIPNVLALSLIFQGFTGKSIKATKSANNIYTLSHNIYIYIYIFKTKKHVKIVVS